MAKDSTKKINITDDLEEKEEEKEVEIKKSERLNVLEQRQNRTEKKISEFYQDKEFSFQKPGSASRGLGWLIVVWSIVFGLVGGTVAGYFILTRESINIPFINKQIELTHLSVKEVNTVTEKNVTVLAETRMADLADSLFTKTVRIFKAKNEGQVSFLEQIYASWQILGLGAFVSRDGWLITAYNFEPETKYVVIDQDNKIMEIIKIVNDPTTGLSFCQIEQKDFSYFELAEKEEIIPGQQVAVLDKLQNLHLTAVSQPLARDIFKTEDLVYSSDKFSEFIRLNVSETAFPQSLIFGLDGKLLGFVSQKVVPAWQVKSLINQVVATGEVKRPFLGLDYLRLDQVTGLTSPRFKDLEQGLIVYGSPVSGSPAEKAGIKNADVIIEADEIVLDRDQDLTYLVQQKNPGEKITLTILRDKENLPFEIILEEMNLNK